MKRSTKQKLTSVTAKVMALVLCGFLLFGTVAGVLFYLL